MEEELLTLAYNNLHNCQLLPEDVIQYIKNLNQINFEKIHTFFIDILFIHINKIYNLHQFKKLTSNNILYLSNTEIDNNISLFIIPVIDEMFLDNYINILLKNIKKKKCITYYEFINFKSIPMYLLDTEFLIKHNINIGSNNNLFNIV